jgi:hypothetical protein
MGISSVVAPTFSLRWVFTHWCSIIRCG